MKRRLAWLAGASIAYGSPHVFSVTDDFLAYPQYDIVFSESYVLDTEASSRLSRSSSDTSSSSSTSTASHHASPSSAQTSPDQPEARPPSTNVLSSDSSASSSSPIPSSYSRMILDSTPYLCALPSPPPTAPENKTNSPSAAEAEASELARATDRGWELLQEMSGQCLYFISGWWSYQFCYSENVKQFHPLPPGGNIPIFPPVEDPTTPSYILGRFGKKKVNRYNLPAAGGEGGALDGGLAPEEGEGSTTTIQAKGSSSSRYLSQKLTGGTICDLTGAPRRVEVQFHCHPSSSDRIGWIKETSTCSYLMIVYTPRLCNDIAFLPERETQAEQVICSEVVKESDVTEWKRKKSREAERLLLEQIESTVQTRSDGELALKQMVGDIEVGAQKLVGGDKGTLKLPERHPGQAVTFDKDGKAVPKGQAIAHQHRKEEGGALHKLSESEMKTLGVDVKTAEAAMKELRSISKGKGWKLEAVWQDGRLEMRGVVGDGKSDGMDWEGVDIVLVDDEGEVLQAAGGGEGQGQGMEGEGEVEDEGQDGYTEEEYRDEL